MAKVSWPHGAVGSTARSLCHVRNSPKTSLPKGQVKRRSTSSIPHTKGPPTFSRTSRQAAREQGGLAHLARALDEHDAVAAAYGVEEEAVGRAHEVEARVQRDGPARRLDLPLGAERRRLGRAQSGEHFLRQPPVVFGAAPQRVLDGRKYPCERVGQRALVGDAHGQDARLAPLLRGLAG